MTKRFTPQSVRPWIPTVLVSMVISLGVPMGCTTTKVPVRTAEQQDPLPDGKTTWSAEVDQTQQSLVKPPKNISPLTGFLLNRAESEFGKQLLPGRLLTWSSDLSYASGALEYFVEKGAKKILDPRLVYLIRLQVSYFVSCAYVIDVNSWKYKDFSITEEEILALQGKKDPSSVYTFSEKEKVALAYALALSRTPVRFTSQLLEDLRRLYSPQEIVTIATLAAKVNYWARLIEALRVKPALYSSDPILKLSEYGTLEP